MSVEYSLICDDTWVQCDKCGCVFLNPHKRLRFK